MSRANRTDAAQVISHAHARDLADCWQDTERVDHPITLLARTGEISRGAEASLRHDLRLLETASATWGSPRSIPEKQLRVLLDYVRHHGPRPPLRGWRALRDYEFVQSIRQMASEARAHTAMVYEPPVSGYDEHDGRDRRWSPR